MVSPSSPRFVQTLGSTVRGFVPTETGGAVVVGVRVNVLVEAGVSVGDGAGCNTAVCDPAAENVIAIIFSTGIASSVGIASVFFGSKLNELRTPAKAATQKITAKDATTAIVIRPSLLSFPVVLPEEIIGLGESGVDVGEVNDGGCNLLNSSFAFSFFGFIRSICFRQ